jgi:hypothetical protein
MVKQTHVLGKKTRSTLELGWQYKYEFRAFCEMTK